MPRATRRGTKVQNSENETLIDETKSTANRARVKRTANLGNKSGQTLNPKTTKSGESGRKSERRGEKSREDVCTREMEGDNGNEEEDLADRIKRNRRSIAKDKSYTDLKPNKKVDPVVNVSKNKKTSKKAVTKKISESDASPVVTAIKPVRKKASKKSFETTIDEIVEGTEKGNKSNWQESEITVDVDENSVDVDENSISDKQDGGLIKTNNSLRQTMSANNSDVGAKVRRQVRLQLGGVKDLSSGKNDEDVAKTNPERSISRKEERNSEEIEEAFTNILVKKPAPKQSNKVLLKPPPKEYSVKIKNQANSKLAPKKSLASRDILSLLSDDEDADDLDVEEIETKSEKGNALKDKTNTMPTKTKITSQSSIQEAFKKTPKISPTKNSSRKSQNEHSKSLEPFSNCSQSVGGKKVPVWKKIVNDSTLVSKTDKSVEDVFNMDCYGEEEFGPEGVRVKKKKKRAPRKRGTKGILVFGGNTKKQVKQICNLKTPGDKNKRKKRVVNIIEKRKFPTATENIPAPNTQNIPIPSEKHPRAGPNQVARLTVPKPIYGGDRDNRTQNTQDSQIPNIENILVPTEKLPRTEPDQVARLTVPKPSYGSNTGNFAESSLIRPQLSLNDLEDHTPLGLPQPRRLDMDSHFSTDFSTGAEAYFDSNTGDDHIDHGDDYQNYFEEPQRDLPDQPLSNRSGLFGQTVCEPPKSYKTPAVPRHMTKLQTKNASTPRTEGRVKPQEPVTVKEQIKNAFGFDDSTDEDENEGESFTISPVRKVADPVLALFNSPCNSICGASSRLSTLPSSRLSTFSTSSRLSTVPKGGFLTSSINAGRKVEEKKDGPFRFIMGPSSNALLAARLMAQARKMPPKFSKPHPKPSSSLKNPVKHKSSSQKDPSSIPKQSQVPSSNLKQSKIPDSISQQSSNHLKVTSGPASYGGNNKDTDNGCTDEPEKVSKHKTDIDVMKMVDNDKVNKQKVKKMVKKVPKNKIPDPDQSSLLEEREPVRSKPQRTAAKAAAERLEELSKSPENEKYPNKENSPVKRKAISKTYAKRNVSKPSVSFDESIPHSPPKKPKVQERKLNQWAALQTSHFSEVDDFDLSFS